MEVIAKKTGNCHKLTSLLYTISSPEIYLLSSDLEEGQN